MKKRVVICSALTLSALLTACSSEAVKTYTATNTDIPEKSFTLSQTPDEAVSFELLEVPCPRNAYLGSFCAYGPDIYYAADYIDYVAPHTGESAVEEVTEEYYTQIFRYNRENGESSPIYTSGGLLQISGLCCDGEQLLWVEQDYSSDELWEVKRAFIGEGTVSADTVLKSSQTEGSLWVIMPRLRKNSLFFYEYTEYEAAAPTHPILLYELDLATGELQEVKAELDLASPYEAVPCREDRLTSYSYGEPLNKIYVDALTSGADYLLETSVDVCSPAANDSYCVWKRGYDATLEPFLYIYDFGAEELSYAALEDHIFDYELMGRFAFVSESGSAIWCLDLEKAVMTPLVTDESYSYQSLFPQNDNTIYARLARSEDSVTLLKISVSE